MHKHDNPSLSLTRQPHYTAVQRKTSIIAELRRKHSYLVTAPTEFNTRMWANAQQTAKHCLQSLVDFR